MKFVSFSVEMYRSLLKKCELNISQLTTIIGPNNEGKSNILRAIVTAVKTLEAISEQDATMYKEGNALVLRMWGRHGDMYNWERDYPLSKRKNGNSSARSRFVLGFSLEDEELAEIRRMTKSLFKSSLVPVCLEFDDRKTYFKINIKGIFNKRASKEKMISVARFITSKISICYIDAVRTSETAAENIARLVELQIRNRLYETEEYRKHLESIELKKGEILKELSKRVGESLQTFLPTVKSLKIAVDERGRSVYWRSPEISVDDGEFTPLSQKGSGVQSLTAIAMARFVSQQNAGSKNCFILAVEEPESHLHPDAIHRVKNALRHISSQTPVIITTHSPLLVNSDEICSNVVVSKHAARPAISRLEIRKLLGVHAADNLSHAEDCLIVEGLSDERIWRAILSQKSCRIAAALKSGMLQIYNAQGCSKVAPVVKFLRAAICNIHVLLDNDKDKNGKLAGDNMIREGVLSPAEVSYLTCVGMQESEMEDLIKPDIYWDNIASQYGIKVNVCKLLCSVKKKWTKRMEEIFQKNGVPWTDEVEERCKTIVADSVVNYKTHIMAIQECRMDIVDAVVAKVESMLTGDR